MSKRNLGTMETDSQNMEEHPEKLSRSDAPAASPASTGVDQLPTTSHQSTSDQGTSDDTPTAVPSLQVQPYKIRCAKLSSVPENAYEENGVPRIAVGQEVGGQFDTLKFLGFGTYATIWLVKNKVDGNYEALKITKSDPNYQQKAKRESQFMNYMIQMGTHENIVDYLGITEITENGAIHQALRFEVLGPNLNEVLNQCELKFHPNVLKNMIKQLLKAVEYVHLKGIIHMDIKPANIMFAICEEDVQSVATSLDDSHNIYHLDLAHANSKFTLKLGDFGIAFKTGVHNDRPAPPTCTYRAPESILTTGLNFPIDMWSVGCVIYKIVTRRSLISCAKQDGHYYDHLVKMAEILGSIPKAPFNNLIRPDCTEYFEADDYILHGENPDTHKIFVDAATRHHYLNATDAEMFSKFVVKFFKLDPKQRVTANKALENDFLLTNEDKSVEIETAGRPGMPSVDPSDASTSQPCSSASGN
uniref:Protein kinase domain-containing protein n=1 Tax=Caenorhabditis tropicalis TaxID=1561998 RepID=A0A1I7U1W5_9PELO